VQKGSILICGACENMIREVESYVWDPKKSEKGYDEPLKKDDHCIDAARYVAFTHKMSVYDYDADKKRQHDWMNNKYSTSRGF